ncbi:MAG: DUF2231 domain-containing protein [Candidatus Acidiferrales bacterium]
MSVNPFDIQSAILAKHAQHAVLVHFPIALFIAGVGSDLIARWTKRRGWADAAYYNLRLAAISTVPAIATGILAWQFALQGQRLKGILLQHLMLALVSTGLIWSTWWLHLRARREGNQKSALLIPLELLGLVAVALTGHLGGFLSGVNGRG